MTYCHRAVILFSLLTAVLSFPEYPNFVPNARNVRINGVRVIGLGHPTATATFTNRNEANPFGIDLDNAVQNLNFNDPQAIWSAICDLDSDNDSVPNKDELCDPNCNNPGGNPVCPQGQELTHPGGVTDIGNALNAQKIHGWLMIFGWCVFAPYGILRAVYFKKKKSVAWFFEHKVALAICMSLTLISFGVMVNEFGLDPLKNGFRNMDSANDTHVIVGIFVVMVVVIQPVSGMLRPPKPKDEEEKTLKRKIWEYQHQFTGRIGIILAFWAIYLGLPLVYDDDGELFGSILIILFILVGFWSVLYVLLYRDVSDTPIANSRNVMETTTRHERKLKSERISRSSAIKTAAESSPEDLQVNATNEAIDIGVVDEEALVELEQLEEPYTESKKTVSDGKHRPSIAF